MGVPDKIIKLALTGSLDRDHLDAYCSGEGISADDFYNRISIHLAKSFIDGLISFGDADCAMNQIWTFMIDDAVKYGDGFTLAEPAYSIYDAFDAGEFIHRDEQDPVEAFTRPALERILSDA